MDIEKIIDAYYQEDTEIKKDSIRNWFSQVSKMTNSENIEECFKSKNFLLRCFYSSKTTTISRSQYQRIKEILLCILDYCHIDKSIIPTREEVIEESNMCGFFCDLHSVLNFIDEVCIDKINDYNPRVGLIRIKSIAILTWLGFSPSEIGTLIRADIKVGNRIYIKKGDEEIEISKELFQILSLQAEQGYVMTFPRGKRYKYKVQTEYVIKDRDGNQLPVNKIYRLFNLFNEASNKLSVLSFKGLQISSLFVSIREDKSNEDLYTKIQRHAHCDKHVSYGYKKLYSQWVKKFFNEEI